MVDPPLTANTTTSTAFPLRILGHPITNSKPEQGLPYPEQREINRGVFMQTCPWMSFVILKLTLLSPSDSTRIDTNQVEPS